MNKKNIVLIGFMGTGKSTVGKKVAQKLRMGFIDTDECIEQQEGLTISDIFSQKGEEYFRNIESEVVKVVSCREGIVVATGGGIVTRKQNVEYLRKNGVIIHLKADVDTILRNTSKSTDRPLLQYGDVRKRIVEMLEQRKQHYRNCDHEIDVSGLDVEQVAGRIISFVHEE